MTGTAIALLAALAVFPVALHPLTRLHRVIPLTVAAGSTLAMLGVAAVLGATAGPATGVGLHVAQCAAVVAAVTGGGTVVRSLLLLGGVDPWTSDANPDGVSYDGAGDDDVETPLRGGRIIGFLERAGVAVTLVVGWPEGLAIILAVKGLARYPELREAHAGEQFIIGTFGSVLYAVATAGAAYLIAH
ncbi:hypothetical protein [Williamsia sterculiae]|uniref:Uncharacterized protein n=1 Tax=Williamsia sterculiae TaxID=1344003 RepID=A0A1N7EKY8_9NOCA|nr:hypothetical protein [Williamsia sterculiae]SIR88757.1 hypothetical protein SAMN05445060_1422 [Williamsia sterculiae]